MKFIKIFAVTGTISNSYKIQEKLPNIVQPLSKYICMNEFKTDFTMWHIGTSPKNLRYHNDSTKTFFFL